MRAARQRGMVVLALACWAVLLSAGGRAVAAPITWSVPLGITGNTDVDTRGTLVGAFNLDFLNTNTTVNGVPFAGLDLLSPTTSSGPFSFSFPGLNTIGFSGLTSTNPPFSGLSAPYQTLLSSLKGSQNPFSLTLTGLTVGDKYEFEWWLNDSTNVVNGRPYLVTAAAVNSVMLSSNTTGANGGVGQFAIGTFTADATSETITFSSGAVNDLIDGLQLRDLGPAATGVPEPATVALFAVGLGGLALGRRRGALLICSTWRRP